MLWKNNHPQTKIKARKPAWGSHGAYMLRREAGVKARARRSWRQDWECSAPCCVPQLDGGGVTLGTSVGSRAEKASEEAILPRSSVLLPSGKASVILHLLVQEAWGWMQKAWILCGKSTFLFCLHTEKDAQKEAIATVQAIHTVLYLANWVAGSKKVPSWLTIGFNLVSFAL